MVAGIAPFLEIVDVIDAVLIEGHGVPHIGLVGAVHSGTEICLVAAGGLLFLRRRHIHRLLIAGGFLLAAAGQRKKRQTHGHNVTFSVHHISFPV